jgi:hypothetical protein
VDLRGWPRFAADAAKGQYGHVFLGPFPYDFGEIELEAAALEFLEKAG